ncbi:MAG: hypothetical protein ACU0GG_09605 [Paracoccaceae bacterium]
MRNLLALAPLITLPFAAAADTARVLDLCLDTRLALEDRVEALQRDGWREAGDAGEAFAVALTLTQLSAGKPEQWGDILERARGPAGAATNSTQFLSAPVGGNAVFIGRNAQGLQTCLFLGDQLDTAPLVTELDGSILRTIGEVTRIRGEGFKSLITAHGMSEAGRKMFTPRLAYAMTFTVVLDRQPGDP